MCCNEQRIGVYHIGRWMNELAIMNDKYYLSYMKMNELMCYNEWWIVFVIMEDEWMNLL